MLPGPAPAAALRKRAAANAWESSDSALELLKRARVRAPLALPCAGLSRLLGNALRPGGGIIEICGVPGAGKTQLCMQICAAAQVCPHCPGEAPGTYAEAVYVDAEGAFSARRYAQICKALLQDSAAAPLQAGRGSLVALDSVLRGMHVCRAYDAEELYSTVKQLQQFLSSRPRVRALVIDSIAFGFRGDLVQNMTLRARVLGDIAALLRRFSAEQNLVVVVTNHMTTRFHRGSDVGWLAPALGETWAHQPSTQLRLERLCQDALASSPLGRATVTKSAEQAAGRSCHFRICTSGVRDAEPHEVEQQTAAAQWAQLGAGAMVPLQRPGALAVC